MMRARAPGSQISGRSSRKRCRLLFSSLWLHKGNLVSCIKSAMSYGNKGIDCDSGGTFLAGDHLSTAEDQEGA